MLSTKIRTTLITLVVAGGMATASAAPTVSEAQINNFGFLHSSEAFKLKTQGNNMPCQPTFPVEGGGVPTPVPPTSRPLNSVSAGAIAAAQQEVTTTLSPLETQTCEADKGTEIAY